MARGLGAQRTWFFIHSYKKVQTNLSVNPRFMDIKWLKDNAKTQIPAESNISMVTHRNHRAGETISLHRITILVHNTTLLTEKKHIRCILLFFCKIVKLYLCCIRIRKSD